METAYIAIVLATGALLRSTIGFGDALWSMALLALAIPLRTATPVVGLTALVVGVVIVVTAWRRIDVRAAAGLIVASTVGVPVGVLLLAHAPAAVVQAALGVVLGAYGLYRLTGPELPRVSSPVWTAVFGFVAGALGAAFNTNGPPIVIYTSLRRWDPATFRATLQAFFLAASVAIVTGHAVGGLWSGRVLWLFAVSVPGVLAGTLLGGVMHDRVDAHRFSQVLSAAFVAFGVLLTVQALR